MRTLLLLTLCCVSLGAQTLTFSIHDNTGQTPDTPLPASYQFAETPQGESASVFLKITNNGSTPALVVLAYVGATAGSSAANPNYTVTGLDENHTLAPHASEYFNLNFTPSTTGQLLGYLQALYIVQQSGCELMPASSTNQCPAMIQSVSTLEGTGTPPQFLLTYNNGQSLQPSATARLDFGGISTSATATITFTLTNETATQMQAPDVRLQNAVFSSSAFSLDTSKLPLEMAANASATFSVTFAPGQTGLATAALLVGSNSYGIEGTGIVVADIDALQIEYSDATGVRGSPQAATPISFGQLVPGTSGGNTLKFTVTNPQTSFNAVTLTALNVTGSAYSLTGGPSLPVTIQPNASITFAVTFTASSSGTFTGTLAVGTRTFTLTGLSVVSPVPSISLTVSQQPLTSAQQASLTIQASSPSKADAIGELAMTFAPSVNGVSDDPTITFLTAPGRQMQVTLAAGSQTATYNNESALAFQTGTTAGTITFTLTFPNTPSITQSYTITPALIHISNATALRQSPALVLAIDGFDNSYTAGQLSFTFYDTNGNAMNSTPMAVDATSNFHQYFYTNDVAGGSFAMQASFPVTGDVTKVGSVAVTLTNAAGQTSTKLTFQ